MNERGSDNSDPRSCRLALDANVLDPGSADRDVLIGRFRDLWQAGRLDVVLVEGVRRELRHPHTPAALRDGMPAVFGPSTRAPSAAQQIARIKVRAILRGDAAEEKHEADAAHLCDAADAGCAYFLTHDRRFSKKRRDLEDALPSIRILGLREFFAIYDEAGCPGAGQDGGAELSATRIRPRT